MKKLLSLLGVFTITASAGGTAFAAKTTTTIQEDQNKYVLNSDVSQYNINSQITNLKDNYDKLSESQKIEIASEMAKMPALSANEIDQFLANSKVVFIRDHQTTIKTMYNLYNSIDKISNALSVSTQSLNVDWIAINNYINLGFGDSNDYTPWARAYGPAHWWTAIWDWGLRADFPEGDINVMRVIKLLFSLYNGIDFRQLSSLLNSGKTVFDYLVNIDDHGDDKVAVLYELVVKVKNDFKNSGVPFTNEIYSVFDEIIPQLEKVKTLPMWIASGTIKNEILNNLGMSVEELGQKYSGILNQITSILDTVNDVLDIIHWTIIGVVWNLIIGAINSIANQMVNADTNHNGVYIKFQQFFIPLGFKSR